MQLLLSSTSYLSRNDWIVRRARSKVLVPKAHIISSCSSTKKEPERGLEQEPSEASLEPSLLYLGPDRSSTDIREGRYRSSKVFCRGIWRSGPHWDDVRVSSSLA